METFVIKNDRGKLTCKPHLFSLSRAVVQLILMSASIVSNLVDPYVDVMWWNKLLVSRMIKQSWCSFCAKVRFYRRYYVSETSCWSTWDVNVRIVHEKKKHLSYRDSNRRPLIWIHYLYHCVPMVSFRSAVINLDSSEVSLFFEWFISLVICKAMFTIEIMFKGYITQEGFSPMSAPIHRCNAGSRPVSREVDN